MTIVVFDLNSLMAGTLVYFIVHLFARIGSFLLARRYVPYILTSLFAILYSIYARVMFNNAGHILILDTTGPDSRRAHSNGHQPVYFVLENRFNFQYLYAIEVIDGKGSVDSGRKIRCEIKYPSGMAISDRVSLAFYVTVANGLWLLEPREEDAKLTDLQYPTGNPNRLSGPRGIAVFLNGDVYIADSDKNCIEVIYKNGTVDTWGSEGSGPGQFSQPKGVALDLDGNVYVADSGNHRIQMFDPDGVFLGSMGNSHSLNNPEGVAVDSHYNVYVADTGNSRIRKLVLNQPRPA